VARDIFRPVVRLAGADDLVARMREGSERVVQFERVLGLHVLAHNALPDLSNGL